MRLFFSRMLGRRTAVLLMLAATSVGAATLDDNVKAMQETNAEAGAVQKNISNLQSQTQAMVEEYKRLTATVDY